MFFFSILKRGSCSLDFQILQIGKVKKTFKNLYRKSAIKWPPQEFPKVFIKTIQGLQDILRTGLIFFFRNFQ